MTDTPLTWRKSTFSGSSGDCVELARSAGGAVLVRNSNHPDAGTLTVDGDALAAWLAAGRAGTLDDLTV
jgi:hypothetical protein